MALRTDLAIEGGGMGSDKKRFRTVSHKEQLPFGSRTSTLLRTSGGDPFGTYITYELPPFAASAENTDCLAEALADSLRGLLKGRTEAVLVAGLGNYSVTPDAVGPLTAEKVLATRHITGMYKDVFPNDLSTVSVLAPGVLGQTGIEAAEILASAARLIGASAVIAVDALAAKDYSRIGCTIQLTDTGISPGSGVGNCRKELSEQTLGIPVVAVGVPTVVDAATLMENLTGRATDTGKELVVTPRDIDEVVQKAAALLALSLNAALQPTLSLTDIRELTA